MKQPTQTEPTNEIINPPQGVNPRALEMIAGLTEEPGSLSIGIADIDGEQCAVARVVDLVPEMMAAFEGAKESDDPDLQRDWTSWRREMEQLGGASNTEVQAVRTGERGRKKEVQVALFGIHNKAELSKSLAELNDLRREDGIEPQDGVPEKYAYLPDTLLAATLEFRTNSTDELRAMNDAQTAAINAGAIAGTNRDVSNDSAERLQKPEDLQSTAASAGALAVNS